MTRAEFHFHRFTPFRSGLVFALGCMLAASGVSRAWEADGSDPSRPAVFLYGNSHTAGFVVLREMTDIPSGVPPAPWLKRKADQLERIGPFRTAVVVAVRDSTGPVPRLAVLLREKGRWSIDPALSYDGIFGWTAGLAAVRSNLFGRNQRLRAGFRTGGLDKAGISWTDPWFGGRLRLFAEMEAGHASYPYRYPDYRPVFRVVSNSASAALGRGFGPALRAGYRRTWENAEAGDPAALVSGGGKDRFVSDEWFMRWDIRDRPEYPMSGLFAEAGRQWTEETGSGRRFSRSYFDCRAYAPAAAGARLALQASGQFLDGRVPVVKRLHWGGSSTLRGYDSGILAGDRLLAFCAEMRFPVLLEPDVLGARNAGVFGVFFADCASIRFSEKSRNPAPNAGAAGAGFHFVWDTIVLRAEWGVRADGGLFVTSASGVKF
ncbi:MAG: BamA/TamA family outer membrane protein [bacterium]|nr:BamA/TamA family outer membrane protein [bacterium]